MSAAVTVDEDLLATLLGDSWATEQRKAEEQAARVQSLYAAVLRARARVERYPHSATSTTEYTRALEAFADSAAQCLGLQEEP